MATINHIRVARLNAAFARECREKHEPPDEFPFWLWPPAARPDPYTRRSNVCPVCHTARALGSGECLC